MQALAAAGGNVNARDNSTSPVLAIAAGGSHTATVQILLAAGAKVNTGVNGCNSALINASQKGYIDAVRVLQAAGADVNHSFQGGGDSQPLTAFLMAKANGCGEIAPLVRKAGPRE